MKNIREAKRMGFVSIEAICAILMGIVIFGFGGRASGDIYLNSDFASSPPTIDGYIEEGEWDMGHTAEFDDGFVTVKNDLLRLYILVDVTRETWSEGNDYLELTFDTNENEEVDRGEVSYTMDETPPVLRKRFYRYDPYYGWVIGDYWPIRTRSSVAEGFGCFTADGSLDAGTIPDPPGGSYYACTGHRVWEFAIDLREIDAAAGEAVRFGLRLHMDAIDTTVHIPVVHYDDFSNLLRADLSESGSASIPAHDPDATVELADLYGPAIHVTQAVQETFNTLPLVEDKTTVVRVKAKSYDADEPQPGIIYLYASRDGADLPGSPLAELITPPVDGDYSRTTGLAVLSDTANFLLPDHWLHGEVEFSATAVDMEGRTDTTDAVEMEFGTTCNPTIWMVPIWEGIWETELFGEDIWPMVVSDYEIERQAGFFNTAYPVAHVNAVRRPARYVRPVPDDEEMMDKIIADLNELHDWAADAAAESDEPFEMPHQIYGLRVRHVPGPRPHGTSDPVWAGGRGYVAVGHGGGPFLDDPDAMYASFDSLMAHELNHNLDRGLPGGDYTWGHHVRDDVCWAGDQDPDWPYDNAKIQEWGFDTRLPWIEDSDERTTVVGKNQVYDIMTYCSRGQDPDRWVSPYRWNTLYVHFLECPDTGALDPEPRYRRMSGTVFLSGGGRLNPVFRMAGRPVKDLLKGNYTVELRGKDRVLYTQSFHASFEGEGGYQRDRVQFSFLVPDVKGVTSVVLKQGKKELDRIDVSANAPQVKLLETKTGEVWKEKQTLQWKVKDKDGDAVTLAVLYSSNTGKTWHPVAWNVDAKEGELEIDASQLPGGKAGKLRIVSSDGFNTTRTESKIAFTVENKPPRVTITSPLLTKTAKAGERIVFEGRAVDLEDEDLSNNAFIWSIKDKTIGVGKKIGAHLPAGVHEITLRVVDKEGRAGSDSITLAVLKERKPGKTAN